MRIVISMSLLVLMVGAASGQIFDEQFDHWPVKLKINGEVIVGTQLPERLILKTLSEKKDGEAPAIVAGERTNRILKKLRLGSDNAASDSSASELAAVIERGGRVFLEGDAAQRAGALAIDESEGLGLLQDCVLMPDFKDTSENRGKLLSVLAKNPKLVGIGLDSGTALHLFGRKMRVTGKGSATFFLMANERQPIRMQKIAERVSRKQSPTEFLVDLTEWRRDAIDRTLEPFPPKEPLTPHVEKGTLLIVGGGSLPKGLMDRFIELAGGKEKARLVFVPCSERNEVSSKQSLVEQWREYGVAHATYLHTKDRLKANTDDAFLEPLKEATGIWFGGGRQWNFADSYYGTVAHKLMKDVLRRGGVIGGSSAGASVQARYLARATPIENFRIMAPGYERGGLGFISGVAIDQHFSERGRQKDMTQLMQHHPQLLGIGIDESTALIVKESIGRISGAGKVHFYDRNQPIYPDRPDYVALGAGSLYDLANRTSLVNQPSTE